MSIANFGLWVGYASTGIALVLTMLYFRQFTRRIALFRREVSRFKMFAVRDRLVLLVASGEVDEEDPAWKTAYATVNTVLAMHQRLHRLDVFTRWVQYNIEAADDPELRERAKRTKEDIRKLSERCPEFKSTLVKLTEAFQHMVGARTQFEAELQREPLYSAVRDMEW